MDGTTFSMYLQGATLLNNTFPGASAFGLEIRKTLDHFISQGAIGNLSATREDSYGIFMNLWYFRCCLVWKTSCFAWYWMIMLWPLPPLRNRKPKKAHRWLATFQTGDRWFMDGLWMVYCYLLLLYLRSHPKIKTHFQHVWDSTSGKREKHGTHREYPWTSEQSKP